MANKTAVSLFISARFDEKSFDEVAKQVNAEAKAVQSKIQGFKIGVDVDENFKDAINKFKGTLNKIDFSEVNKKFLSQLYNADSDDAAEKLISNYSDTVNRFAKMVSGKNKEFQNLSASGVASIFEIIERLGSQQIEIEVVPKFDNFEDDIKQWIAQYNSEEHDKVEIGIDLKESEDLAGDIKSQVDNAAKKVSDGTVEVKTDISPETDSKNAEAGDFDVGLQPKLKENFKTDAQDAINELGDFDVGLQPKLKENFKTDAQDAINELGDFDVNIEPKKDFVEKVTDIILDEGEITVGINVHIDNEEELSRQIELILEDSEGSTVHVKGNINDTFIDEIQNQINKKSNPSVLVSPDIDGSEFGTRVSEIIEEHNISADIPVDPILSEDFRVDLQSQIDGQKISVDVPINQKIDEQSSDKNDESENPFATGMVELFPTTTENFQEYTQALIDRYEYKVTLNPTLSDTFKKDAEALVSSNDMPLGYVYITPYISDYFQEDVKLAVFDQSVRVPLPIKLETSESFDADLMAIRDHVTGIWNTFDGLNIPDISKALKVPKNIDEVNTAISKINSAVADFDLTTFERFLVDIESLSNLKLSKTLTNNLSSLGAAVRNIYDNLKDLSSLDNGSATFISSIETLLSRSDELRDLAAILKQTKLSDLNTISKQNSKSANDAVIQSYKELISAKRELLSLQKEYNKAADSGSKKNISDNIKQRQGEISTLQTKLEDALNADGVSGNFASWENQLDKCNNDLAVFEQRLLDIQRNNEQVTEALKADSAEWGTALSILNSSGKFKDAIHEGQIYYDLLEDIVSIERTVRTDNLTGASYLSYKFADSKGNQITTGLNGDLEIERKKILDLTDANKQLKKAREEARKVSITGESNDLIDSLNNQLQAFDQKYQNKFKPQTQAEAQEYQALANAIADTVLQLQLKRKEQKSSVDVDQNAASELILDTYRQLDEEIKKLRDSEEELLNKLKSGDSTYADTIQSINEQKERIDALKSSIAELKGEYNINPSSSGLNASINDTARQIKDLDKQIDTFREIQTITEDLVADSGNWGDVLKTELGQTQAEVDALIQKLGEIQSIVKKNKTDNLTGASITTYNVKGSLGRMTFGSNANNGYNVVQQQTYAENVTAQYKEIQKAIKLVSDEETKAANNRKTLSAAQQAQLIAVKNILEEIKQLDGVDGRTLELNSSAVGSTAQYKKLADNIKEITNAYNKLGNGSSQTSINKFLNKVYEWMNRNSKGAAIYSTELETLINTVKTLGSSVDLKAAEEQFLNLANSIEAAGLQGQTFSDRIKDQVLNSAASLVTTYLSVQDIIRYAGEAIGTIEDLDYALLDLKKTTAMSDDELEEFYYSASDIASQVGITTEEVIDLTSSWSRLGYATRDMSEDMARLSAEFAAISPGMTTSEAQEGMVSIMKAYDIDDAVEIRREIMDNINALGKMLPKRMVTYGALCA